MQRSETIKKQGILSIGVFFDFFRHLLWGGAVLSYYFQFPFPELAPLIVPFFASYFLLSARSFFLTKLDRRFFVTWTIFSVFLTLNLFISIGFLDTQDTAWRFYAILLVIPLCFFLRNEHFTVEYQIFKYLSVLKALFLIAFASYMVFIGDYVPFRIWANTMGGDMYFVYDFFPRIQLQGNALLLVALFFEAVRVRKCSLVVLLFFCGVVIEGNFSFYLAVVVFMIYNLFRETTWSKISIKRLMVLGVIFFSCVCFLSYSLDQKEQKEGKGNRTRAVQIEILMDTNHFWGNGLGAKVFGNTILGRDVNDKYFELQTLYIYYQIGMIGLLLFYLSNILALKEKKMGDVWTIYAAYLIASFFNPYCFDVTHMVVATICGNFAMLVKDPREKDR